jgi:hypothetical protein
MSANVESSTNESNDARNDEREATELQSYEQHAVRNAASVTTTVDDDNHSVRINRLKGSVLSLYWAPSELSGNSK